MPKLSQERGVPVKDSVIDAFDVRRIAVEELDDLNALVVGLAENPDGSGMALLISTTLTAFDAQDRALGEDTYSISTEWGATMYGGLTGCVRQDAVLTLTFDADVAKTLGMGRPCRLHLQVDDESIVVLQGGLRRVCATAPTPPAYVAL